MIICIIVKMHYKRLLQMQDLHGVFTACTRRAHNAALSNTLCKHQAAAFVLSMSFFSRISCLKKNPQLKHIVIKAIQCTLLSICVLLHI